METDITFKLQNTDEVILELEDEGSDAIPRQYEDIKVGDDKYVVFLVQREYTNKNAGRRSMPRFRQDVTVFLKEIGHESKAKKKLGTEL